jgi:hypothetical protein
MRSTLPLTSRGTLGAETDRMAHLLGISVFGLHETGRPALVHCSMIETFLLDLRGESRGKEWE